MLTDFPITEMDADETEQGTSELEEVTTRYGMYKSLFNSSMWQNVTGPNNQ